MTAKEVIAKLEADGWQQLKGKKDAHRQFKHPSKPGKVTVSMHPGDIPIKTLKCIAKQAQLKL